MCIVMHITVSIASNKELMSENLPQVSVVTVAHNNRDELEACLDSLENQTYPNLELIVVDSGSKGGQRRFRQDALPRGKVD